LFSNEVQSNILFHQACFVRDFFLKPDNHDKVIIIMKSLPRQKCNSNMICVKAYKGFDTKNSGVDQLQRLNHL